jgi:hypothetical protein
MQTRREKSLSTPSPSPSPPPPTPPTPPSSSFEDTVTSQEVGEWLQQINNIGGKYVAVVKGTEGAAETTTKTTTKTPTKTPTNKNTLNKINNWYEVDETKYVSTLVGGPWFTQGAPPPQDNCMWNDTAESNLENELNLAAPTSKRKKTNKMKILDSIGNDMPEESSNDGSTVGDGRGCSYRDMNERDRMLYTLPNIYDESINAVACVAKYHPTFPTPCWMFTKDKGIVIFGHWIPGYTRVPESVDGFNDVITIDTGEEGGLTRESIIKAITENTSEAMFQEGRSYCLESILPCHPDVTYQKWRGQGGPFKCGYYFLWGS